ncbi:MAG: hypothetical protein CSA36_03440, partial [Draconibacterium sp.]
MRIIFKNRNFITLLILALLSTQLLAQDKRTIDTKVADLLAQMPTKDLQYRDRLMREMIQLGPDVFQKIAGQLFAPGTGDDTAPRYAINSLARYASEFGKEAERDFVERNILEAIEHQQNEDVKAFLIHQLNFVAGNQSVAVLRKYLVNNRLSEPATQVLLQLGGPQVALELNEALAASDGKVKVTLVRALGELKCKKAVPQITSLLKSSDPVMQKAALAALANIGDPISYKILYNAAAKKGFAYDASNAAEAFLNYTARLAEED